MEFIMSTSPVKEGLTLDQAKAILDSFPYGIVGHDAYEDDSFVFKTRSGKYKFYEAASASIEEYDWDEALRILKEGTDYPLASFYYEPGSEMVVRQGGLEWFKEIRSQ